MQSVVIVGSGPYGLSLAAHLGHLKIKYRAFGQCMETWENHMPPSMLLKSEGFASDLYAPGAGYPLSQFCRERNIPYKDIGIPVHRRTFVEYGKEFQRRMVPQLEQTMIKRLSRFPGGFELQTADGQVLQSRRVVLAVGITHFAYLPPMLRGLPQSSVSHSYDHGDLGKFKGRRVLVIGAGASAIDIAIDLKKAGAAPELMARAAQIQFHSPSVKDRLLTERLLMPRSAVGLGWRSKLLVDFPLAFHLLPEKSRHRTVARHLGPAPGWFARAEFEGHVPTHLGSQLLEVIESGSCLRVAYLDSSGAKHEIETDNIIAATGYRPVLRQLPFLDESLASEIKTAGESPKLDQHFRSTVPGLYMVGLASANNFGPLCRFACGAAFTTRRLAKHLAQA